MAARLAVVNRSSLVSDADCFTAWRAISEQMRLHVAPAWERLPMESVLVTSAGQVPAGHIPVYVLDDPDRAHALGYHAQDPLGRAYGRVFTSPILRNGGTVLHGSASVSATLSHEVIELFIDRGCDLWSDRSDGTLVAYEAVDPVALDDYPIRVPDLAGRPVDVSVSNFVLSAWFDPQATAPGTQYDWLRRTSAPLQVRPGGYVVTWDTVTGRVEQVFANDAGRSSFLATRPANTSSRIVRRMVG